MPTWYQRYTACRLKGLPPCADGGSKAGTSAIGINFSVVGIIRRTTGGGKPPRGLVVVFSN